MSQALDPSLLNLNDCGCCEGLGAQTPVEVVNLPGLSAIAYRVGTHSQFKASMLASLSSFDKLALSNLKTRDDDDFSIALLDAWATAADVLTFYQERIANESYLRTATERFSLLQLARLIGYELRPGVAASTYLSFTVEDAPGAPGQATIVAGLQVRSIPNPGQLPQLFETIEQIEARAEWNALQPRLTEPQPLDQNTSSLLLAGTSTNLKPGDRLLLVTSYSQGNQQNCTLRRVLSVVPDRVAQMTRVELADANAEGLTATVQTPQVGVFALRAHASLFGANAPDWKAMPTSVRDSYPGGTNDWPPPGSNGLPIPSASQLKLDAVYNQILPGSWIAMSRSYSGNLYQFEGFLRTELERSGAIFTGNSKASSILPMSGGGNQSYYDFTVTLFSITQVTSVTDSVAVGYTLSSKITQLALDSSIASTNYLITFTWGEYQVTTSLAAFFNILDMPELRGTNFYCQSEQLTLAEQPLTGPIQGDQVVLDRVVPGLQQGQKLMVSGKRIRVRVADNAQQLSLTSEDGSQSIALNPGDVLLVIESPVSLTGGLVQWHLMDIKGDTGFISTAGGINFYPAYQDDEVTSEVAFIKDTPFDDGHYTTIPLGGSLQNAYDRTTVSICANVALATHGETVQVEVLGSGDGSQPYQGFTLRQSPLTYTSAATPSGAQSSLRVRVNDIEWHEVPSLYGYGPRDRVFVTRTDNAGKTTVEFGDGITGARVPTGQENVRATYRKGIGVSGLVNAGLLSLLITRPLGVKSVINAMAASGADDPESLDDARRNAPLTIQTMGRIVSLQDYEDFARSFAGIAKALATWTWSGQVRGAFVTVAGPNGTEVRRDSDLYANLVSAMQQASDPYIPLSVQSYREALFRLAAKVKVDSDYRTELVLAAVEQALRLNFSFDARSFGQPVMLSEVLAVMQAVPGVLAVDVYKFCRSDDLSTCTLGLPPARLPAATPQAGVGTGTAVAAELLTLNPGPLDDLGVMP